MITAALEEQGYFRADVPLEYELQDVLHTAAEANGVPYHVALGLIYVESRFDPEAVSPAGCRGLCQLHPRYFPADLTPAENIEAGMEYLGSLIERCGDLSAALTAYHAGSDTGDRAYADQVMRAAEVWDAQMHTEAESFGGEILQKEAGI
ncbi:transglycosylase SLT domain-containing protein [Lawsonibacter hominis]|uniref:transglycosylase SLT domain-containing protein n=1 Tax=Lawsonibacter hominis TaxID=2763053 RepID=UPI001FAD1EA6|nr:transglycosylase SLT domain-containing protein [Lawsonibacter hominis]